MNQQLAMFQRIAAGDHSPNEHGLFDIAQLAHLADKRECKVVNASDYGCDVGYRCRPPVKIMATDKGLWHPVNIFRACREAAGQPHYAIDYAKAKIKNPGGLDEVRIAEVIGADGVRPYLSRPSPFIIPGLEGRMSDGHRNGATGTWTWPMALLVHPEMKYSGKSYDYRRAVRTLDDAGLLKLRVGPRGGFGTATFEWMPLAYLQPIERKQTLEAADDEAMAAFGA